MGLYRLGVAGGLVRESHVGCGARNQLFALGRNGLRNRSLLGKQVGENAQLVCVSIAREND